MTERMPQCVGMYERAEVECDGDPNGESEEDRAPCGFRDRCAALQRVIKDTGRERSRIITLKTIEEEGEELTFAFAKGDAGKLDAVLNRAISMYGIKDGQITRRTPPAKPRKKPKADPDKAAKAGRSVSPAGRKAGEEARTEAWGKAKEGAALLASWATKRLEASCSRVFVESMEDAHEGDFILVDRMVASNYIAVYAKAADGRRLAICTGQPNSRTKRIQIRLAIGFGDYRKVLSADDWKRLAPEDYEGKDGSFRTRIMGLDKEGVSVVAESIAEAIRQGIIDLPEVG